MSLYWPQQASRKAPGRKWPDKDVLWIKMLWLNWMEVDQITSRTGIDKRTVRRFCGLEKLDWRFDTKQDDNFINEQQRLYDIALKRRAEELASHGEPDPHGPRPYTTHDPIPNPRKRPWGAKMTDPHVIAYYAAKGKKIKTKSSTSASTSASASTSYSKPKPAAAAKASNNAYAEHMKRKAAERAAVAHLPPLPPPFPVGLEKSLALWPNKPWPARLLGTAPATGSPPAPGATEASASAAAKGKRKADDQDADPHNDNDDALQTAPSPPSAPSSSDTSDFSESESDASDVEKVVEADARAQKRARTDRVEVMELSSDDDTDMPLAQVHASTSANTI